MLQGSGAMPTLVVEEGLVPFASGEPPVALGRLGRWSPCLGPALAGVGFPSLPRPLLSPQTCSFPPQVGQPQSSPSSPVLISHPSSGGPPALAAGQTLPSLGTPAHSCFSFL